MPKSYTDKNSAFRALKHKGLQDIPHYFDTVGMNGNVVPVFITDCEKDRRRVVEAGFEVTDELPSNIVMTKHGNMSERRLILRG